MVPVKDLIEKYKTTHSYDFLVKKHSMREVGIWQIFGEDPNRDMGGHHHTPLLDTVEGELGDVIAYAVDLPGFWQWGGGGNIKKIDIRDVKTVVRNNAKRQEIEEQIAVLQKQLKEL